MSDRDIDRLLAGKAPEGDEAVEELAAFLQEVKAAYLKAPADSTEARQLATILEAAQLQTDKGESVARPPSKATGPAPQASGLPNWRQRLVLTQLFSSLWARIAVASVAAALASGGLAFAGALPDPLQAAAADAANQVGVSLDDPNDVDELGDVDSADDGTANRSDDDADERDDDAGGGNAKAKHDDDANQTDDADAGSNQGGVVNTNQANGNLSQPVDDDASEGDDDANEGDDDANKPDDDADEGDDDDHAGANAGEDDDEDADEPEDGNSGDDSGGEDEGGSDDD
jgi:hypothetical protein